jgi:hypothetical protein
MATRTKGVFCYLTPKEKEFLKTAASKAGLSQSDYLRYKIFKQNRISSKLDKILKICEGFE